MDFSLKSQFLSDGVMVIEPEGSIDSFSSDSFAKQTQHLVRSKIKAALLDLGKVRYISSVGLGALIGIMKKAKEQNAYFAVYDPQISVKRVLEISKLDFLILKPQETALDNPFAEYVRIQEPKREPSRKAQEESRKKYEEELNARTKKEKAAR